VEFGRDFATPAQGRYCVFGQYKVPPLQYSLAFGGILPLVSLMFARILSNTAETEVGANPELVKAKQNIKELQSDLQAAEQRFAAAEDLVVQLFAQEKRQRIPAAAERWPELPASSAAIVAGASPSYASKVLKSRDGR